MSTVTHPPDASISTGVQAHLRAQGHFRTELLQAIGDLERQLRRLRRSLETPRTSRDLAAEIEQALEHRPWLTTPEVAKAITKRESTVRAILKEHPDRFSARTGVPGRSPQARCWNLAPKASKTQPDTPAESQEVSGD